MTSQSRQVIVNFTVNKIKTGIVTETRVSTKNETFIVIRNYVD